MKAIDIILKLAKVSSPEELYKKYGSEEEFMKAHGKDFKDALNRQRIEKAQSGKTFPNIGTQPGIIQSTGISSPTVTNPQLSKPTKLDMSTYNKLKSNSGLGLNPIIDIGSQAIDAAKKLKEEIEERKRANQWMKVSDVQLQAAQSPTEREQRHYLRPEDMVNTGEEFFPIYGVGTNVLSAKKGGKIPKAYSGLQFNTRKALLDTDQNELTDLAVGLTGGESAGDAFQYIPGVGPILKQIAKPVFAGIGNLLDTDQNDLTDLAVGLTDGESAGSMFGEAAGDAFQYIPGVGPILKQIAKPVFAGIGNLLDTNPEKTKKYKKQTDLNINKMLGMNGALNQFGSFMEEGGNVNPQIIKYFGNHKLSDLLRTGGNLSSNLEDSGELQLSRGRTESISDNPYSGETLEFIGPSHAEGGMPVSYGGSPVEVEGGEPAIKMQNGGEEENLIVFGNIPIPGYKGKTAKRIVKDIADKETKEQKKIDKSMNILNNINPSNSFDKLKMSGLQATILGANMKLKKFAEEKEHIASLQEAINATADEMGVKAPELAKGKIKFEKKKEAYAQTGDYVYGEESTQDNKVPLSYTQGYHSPTMFSSPINQAYLSYLMKKIKTNYPEAKKEIATQLGIPETEADKFLEEFVKDRDRWEQTDYVAPYDVPKNVNIPITVNASSTSPVSTETTNDKKNKKSSDKDITSSLSEALRMINPRLWRPSDVEELDPRQIMGELAALTERTDPVYAQQMYPQLTSPYDISFDEQKNNIISQTRAAQRLAGSNAAAQAMIAAQAQNELNNVDAAEFRANQEMQNRTYAENRNLLNQTMATNLQLLDQQYARQTQAASNTKAILRAAMESIGDKYAKNQLENRTLATYENLYNYRFDDNFRAGNYNPAAVFNTDIGGSGRGDYERFATGRKPLYEKINGEFVPYNTIRESASNGAILKMVKNL